MPGVALRKPEFAADVAPHLPPLPYPAAGGRLSQRATCTGVLCWATGALSVLLVRASMTSHAFAYRTGVTDAQVRNGAGITFQFVVATGSWLVSALPAGTLVAVPGGHGVD